MDNAKKLLPYAIVAFVFLGFLIFAIGQTGNHENTYGNVSNNTNQPPVKIGKEIAKLMDDDIKLGSDNAPVVVIEFSDYQCPFCRKFWLYSFSKMKTEYIDTGKVQFVYRDFPLLFHQGAEKGAQAVECADVQNKGWEMHDKIFAEQATIGSGTVIFTVNDLKQWATQLGLDREKFDSCLDSGEYANEINKDYNDGLAAGASGTPYFILAKRDGTNTVPLSGAQSYSTFKATIDQLLQN